MLVLLFLLLAALWGSSFLFLRVAVPEFGVFATAGLRVGIAWLGLSCVGFVLYRGFRSRTQPLWPAINWRDLALVGSLNSALPFTLYSLAAVELSAGYMAILNALVPLWGGLLAVRYLNEPLRPKLILGVVLAIAGVALLMRLGPLEFSMGALLSVLACAGATLCYAVAGIIAKKRLAAVPSFHSAERSLLFASLMLMPFGAVGLGFAAPVGLTEISLNAWAAVIALGLFCTALAYMLFFRLIREWGPTRATSVTFLIPAFGVLWGALFLGEPLTLAMFLGFGLVLLASLLVVRV